MTISSYSLYALCDPVTKVIRYIGLSNHVKNRYRKHISVSLTCDPQKRDHKQKWIAKLGAQGLKPILVVIDEGLDLATAKEREIDLIAAHVGLVNTTKGGDAGPWDFMTPEQKARTRGHGNMAARRELKRIQEKEPERWAARGKAISQAVRNSEKSRLASSGNIKKAQAAARGSEKVREAGRQSIKLAHEATRRGITDKQRKAMQENAKKASDATRAGPSPAQLSAWRINAARMRERNAADNFAALKKPRNVSEAGKEAMREHAKDMRKNLRLKRLAFGDPLQPPLWE